MSFSSTLIQFVLSLSLSYNEGAEVLMFVTTAELQKNLTKYIILSETEQIFVTENGRVVAMLLNPNQNRIETAKSLFGILPSDVSLEELKDERFSAIAKRNLKKYVGKISKSDSDLIAKAVEDGHKVDSDEW